MEYYDVAVIGAGPAGTAAAYGAASAGLKVLILEEHKQIGSPLHCSGFVSPRTLDVAEVGRNTLLNQVTGAEVYASTGRSLTIGGDKVHGLVLDRVGLDQALADRAMEAGSHLRLGYGFVGASSVAGGIAVAAKSRQGEMFYVKTRLLVGADGWRSRVASLVEKSSPSEVIWCLGGEALLPGHPRDLVRIYLGESIAPDWFGWTIPVDGNRVRIGIGTPMGPRANKPRHLLSTFINSFPKHFSGLEIKRFSGGFIPLYSRRPVYGDGVLLVGDAAGHVKSTSGGGIYASLIAGQGAARIAVDALRNDDTSAASLSAYQRWWDEGFGRELKRCADLRSFFLKLSPAKLDMLMRLASLRPVRHLLNRYGDIDFPSWCAYRLARVLTPLLPAFGVQQTVGRRWQEEDAKSFSSESYLHGRDVDISPSTP